MQTIHGLEMGDITENVACLFIGDLCSFIFSLDRNGTENAALSTQWTSLWLHTICLLDYVTSLRMQPIHSLEASGINKSAA